MTALLYVYCILDADSPALDLLERAPVEGVDLTEPVFALRAGAIAAAVSAVPAADFDEEPLRELTGELARLAPYAVRHEQVIRTLFERASSLLPLSFGSVYRSCENVLAMLTARADELRAHLEQLRGQEEWEVKLFREPALQLGALARARTPESQAIAGGPGRAYLLARLQERRVAADALAQAATVAATVAETLQASATDVRRERLDAPDTGGVELVERFAALVRRTDTERFQECVAALERRHAPAGFSIALSGPWAPYSFVVRDTHGC